MKLRTGVYHRQILPILDNDLPTMSMKILENLDVLAVRVDELVRQCHLSPPLVLTILSELGLGVRFEQAKTGHCIASIG